ncbi:unnamed protein product [Agarophyton chilense]
MTSSRSPKMDLKFITTHGIESSSLSQTCRASSGPPSSVSRSRGDEKSTSSKVLRKYPCPICGATFAQNHDAQKHRRTVHDKLRPFTCEICGSSFGEKGNLSKHKKSVHFKEKPHGCDICGAHFSFKDGLQRHRSLVHLDHKPHKCEVCGATFKQKSQLRKHFCTENSAKQTKKSQMR